MSHRRKQQDKRRLKKLSEQNKMHDRNVSGAYYDEDKQRYVRYSPSRKGSSYPKYLRRRANKMMRRRKGLFSNGMYRKAYDYKWMIW